MDNEIYEALEELRRDIETRLDEIESKIDCLEDQLNDLI